MKKIIAWLLILTLAVGTFAGCRKAEKTDVVPTTEVTATADDAIKYLMSNYLNNGATTPIDYTRMAVVRVSGIPFDVVWSVDVGEDLIVIVDNGDGTVTVDVNEQAETETPYKLTATITDAAGNVASFTWDYILPEGVDMVEVVKTAYALAPGQSLPYESRLIGKVIAIDKIYDASYDNISVVIAVEGAEDMPILCYRMKGEGIENILVGNIITVTGTIKNYEGTIEFDSGCVCEKIEKGDAIEAPTDPGEILKAAYALADGASLPYQTTLTGTVTAITAPYDANYGNISVEIVVDGYAQYPILCYRLKGDGVEEIAIDDLITVTGMIKNYKGTIEFDTGCMMLDRVSGGGTAQKPSDDADKILADLGKLGYGDSLPYIATLTGTIYSVDRAYDPNYGNITVTMIVNGWYVLKSYNMKGDGIESIGVTDRITVTGIIKNYNGTIEFDKATLMDWSMGSRTAPVNFGSLKENTAYNMKLDQKGLEQVFYFEGGMSGSYLATSQSSKNAAEIFVEHHSGKGVRFFYEQGGTKQYIEIFLNEEGKSRPTVTTEPTKYWNYDPVARVYMVMLNGGRYCLGTYGTYSTLSASSTSYLVSGSSSPQYVVEYIPAGSEVTEEKTGAAVVVETPETGVAYKFGFNQTSKGELYFFTGKMSGYYGGTDTNFDNGVDVMVEETEGGYYLTFNDGKKQYITIEPSADGAHINFTFSTTAKSVFTYNEEYDSFYTQVNGTNYYMGTNGTFVTFNAIKEASLKYNDCYPAHLYLWDENAVPEEPDEPDVPAEPGNETLVTEPVVGTAYKFGMNQVTLGDIYFFTGAKSGKYMATSTNSADAVDVYLEQVEGKVGEAYLYFMDGDVKTYITMEAYKPADKNYYVADVVFTTEVPSLTYTWDETLQTIVCNTGDGGNFCFGTHGTYNTISCTAEYYYSGNNAANVDQTQFIARFYTVDESETPDTPPAEGEVVTIDLTNKNNRTEYDKTSHQVWEQNGIKLTNSKASSTSDIGDYAPIRLYQNTAMVIEYPGMTKLVFNCSSDNKNDFAGRLEASITGATVTVDGLVVTVVLPAAADSFEIAAMSAQVRLDSVTVYTGTATETPDDPDTPDNPDTPPAGETLTIADAIALGQTFAHDTFSAEKYYVTGEITEVYNPQYGNMRITDGNGNILTIYGTYSADGNTRYDAMSVKPVAGDTVTIYGVVGQYDGNSQIKNGWLMEHIPGSETPDTPDEPGTETLVTEPEVGTAYKFGMNQVTLGDVYFFTGKMSGKYMGTTTNAAEAVDVYLEQVSGKNGEYYMYFMDGDVKTYITMEEYKAADKDYYSAKVVLTTDVPSVTFTWNETLQTVVCNTGSDIFCFGTYGTFDTISCTSDYYFTEGNAASVDKTQFIGRFYTVDESGNTDTPDSPVQPDEPDAPAVTGLKTGDKVVIFAPAYNKALSADPVTAGSFYNKGVDITVDGGKVSGYGDAEVWTVTVNSDGTYSFANGGKNIGMQAKYASMSLGAENDKWELIALGGALFNVKNTGRDNMMEWFAEKGNWSTFNSSSAATDGQYQLSFYVIDQGILGESGNTDTPDSPVQPDEPDAPAVTGLKTGDKVVIFAPAYNKALSADPVTAGSFYNKGVDITVDGGKVSGYGDAEVWTVTVNSDGTYSFANGGKNIGMQAKYASMSLGAENDKWELIALGGALFNVKNTGRDNMMEWFAEKGNWSTFNSSSAATDGQYQLSFYVIDQGIMGESGNTDTPDEPDSPVQPDEPDAPAVTDGMISSVENLSAGTYFMAGYLESYVNGSTPYDFTAAPYHVWSGSATGGRLDTTGYAFEDGVLSTTATSNLGAAMVLEAVSGKANTYYIKCGDQYLSVGSYANHTLTLGDTKAEWVATNNAKGGITMSTATSGGTIYMGTAGATKQMIRNYKSEGSTYYGVVFFAVN